jgi:hypothetical protein
MHKFSKIWEPSQNCRRQKSDCSKLHSEGPQILCDRLQGQDCRPPGAQDVCTYVLTADKLYLTFQSLAVTVCTTSLNIQKILHSSQRIFISFLRVSGKTVEFSLCRCFSTFVRPRPGKFFFHKTRARSQQIYS